MERQTIQRMFKNLGKQAKRAFPKLGQRPDAPATHGVYVIRDSAHKLKIREPHVITVTGKAFYDIGHAPADHSNRRSTPKGYAVWEIHPMMGLQVITEK